MPPLTPPGEDGEPAPVGRRALAWTIDFALVLTVAVALGTWTVHRISAYATEVTGMAGVGAWRLLTSKGDIEGAALGSGVSLWHSAVASVEEAFILLVLFEFAYVFGALAWRGRTLGKALLDVQVRPRRPDLAPALGTSGVSGRVRLGKGRAARRATVTTATDTALFALACCVLLQGDFLLAVLCWLIAVGAFWANVLPLLGRRRRTIADRVAGSVVSRTRMYRSAVVGAVQSGRTAAQGSVRGGRAAVEGAMNMATPERVQRIQDAGRGAAVRGRKAWRKAGDVYRDRRADRLPGPPPARLGPPPAELPGTQPPPAPPAWYAPPLDPPPDALPPPTPRSGE